MKFLDVLLDEIATWKKHCLLVENKLTRILAFYIEKNNILKLFTFLIFTHT